MVRGRVAASTWDRPRRRRGRQLDKPSTAEIAARIVRGGADRPPQTIRADLPRPACSRGAPDGSGRAGPCPRLGTLDEKFPNTQVQTEDGETHNLTDTAKIEVCDEQCLDPAIDNLIMVNDLNENSLLHILRSRFKQDKIYSNVASILVAINPFKKLPLYTPEQMEAYRDGSRGKPPHIFGIGIDTFEAMMADRKNQSVVISGESGAGKTVNTKLVLQFVSDVSARLSGKAKAEGEAGIEEQVLQTNPILESQGNAKTLRNNNSSRFGKLITVKFDTQGGVVGASIIDYLLEKSRVTFQAEGERNYHVFYMVPRHGAGKRLRERGRGLVAAPPRRCHVDRPSRGTRRRRGARRGYFRGERDSRPDRMTDAGHGRLRQGPVD